MSRNLILNMTIISFLLSSSLANIGAYMMMPFKTMSNEGQLASDETLQAWFNEIEQKGFQGVTLDFWWGLIEQHPQAYDFSAYRRFAELLGTTSLKLKVIMSFHQCGSTVGDDCYIPLPQFVLDSDKKFFYRDQNMQYNYQYISIFADNEKMEDGRTPLEMYSQFMAEFKEKFQDVFGSVIVDVELGSGPAGQLHYPSYSYKDGFCGVGFFQTFGELAKQDFKNYTQNVKIETIDDWSRGRIHKMGLKDGPLFTSPSSKPDSEYFFQTNVNIETEKCEIYYADEKEDCGYVGISEQTCQERGCCFNEVRDHNHCFRPKEVWNYKADFGKVYTHWYQQAQLVHLQKLLSIAREILTFKVPLSIKIPCVHWMVGHPSRAAERTAGFNIAEDFTPSAHFEKQTLNSQNGENKLLLIKNSRENNSDLFESIRNRNFQDLSEYLNWAQNVNTYHEIFHLTRLFKAKVVFSCMELSDNDFSQECQSKPQTIINVFKELSAHSEVPIVAENSESLLQNNFEGKLNIIEQNLEGFYQFNYMRFGDAVSEELNSEIIFSRLIQKLHDKKSKNFYRRRKIVLIEEISCRNCYNDLAHFKHVYRLI